MIELYRWKHPRTGQKRYYLNTWKEAIGLSLDYYNTGNIRAASLRGEGISNSKARQIHMKLWFDEEKNLHIDGFNGGARKYYRRRSPRVRQRISRQQWRTRAAGLARQLRGIRKRCPELFRGTSGA